jgi:hypothetical protein
MTFLTKAVASTGSFRIMLRSFGYQIIGTGQMLQSGPVYPYRVLNQDGSGPVFVYRRELTMSWIGGWVTIEDHA